MVPAVPEMAARLGVIEEARHTQMGIVAAQAIDHIPERFRICRTMLPFRKISPLVDEGQGHRQVETDLAPDQSTQAKWEKCRTAPL